MRGWSACPPARSARTTCPTRCRPLVLLVGDEDLLVDRAVSAIAAAARRADPGVIETERAGVQIEGSELHELLGPSLFGDARLMVIRAAQDVRVAARPCWCRTCRPRPRAPRSCCSTPGGAKGKAVLELARKAKALEIGCAKLTRAEERADFVRDEVRRGRRPHRRRTPLAVLIDAVGSDLRELAAVAGAAGQRLRRRRVDVDLVRAFHTRPGRGQRLRGVRPRRGRAQRCRRSRRLRHALTLGVPHVVIADALADGVRSVARVVVGRAGAASSTWPSGWACRRGR